MRLVRLLLQRSRAPELNFPLRQSRLRFCNKGFSSISPPQVGALFSSRRRTPPERDVTPVLDEACAELALSCVALCYFRFLECGSDALADSTFGSHAARESKRRYA